MPKKYDPDRSPIESVVIEYDPKRLKLLELNARYMRHETFKRLSDNIEKDGDLTQIPFCAIYKYFSDEDEIPLDSLGDPVIEVLSGNHRVKAAIDAKLETIKIQVTYQPLSKSRRYAIQLSHNEVSGDDDPAILKEIYESIHDVEWQMYTGLTDEKLALLDDIQIGSIGEANLLYTNVGMMFLPHEAEMISEVWEIAERETKGQKHTWLVDMEDYNNALDSIELACQANNIKNTALGLLIVLEVFSRHISDLKNGWMKDNELRDGFDAGSKVPVATLINDIGIPADDGLLLERAINKLVGTGEIDSDDRNKAIGILAKNFLGET